MTTLHMDTPAVETTISTIKSAHGAIQDAINNANGSVSGLVGTGFQGPSAEQFREAFNQLNSNLQTQLTTLDELSNRLQRELEEWKAAAGTI